MTTALAMLAFPSAALLAFVVTGAMRRYAIAASIIDLPNDRSSHSVPTPRGGGVGVVVAFTAAILVQATTQAIPVRVVLALLGSGLPVALVGYVDDRHPLPARLRFAVHAAASTWALWCMGGIPPVPIFGFVIDLGAPGLVLATAYLLWMINLFNFMDGIDGLAGVESITVSLGGALCWWLATRDPAWATPVLFACCVAGFLAWNFPPAKIFMGDVGSGFLGMILGTLSLWSAQKVAPVFWSWFILIGCFMVDATTTLVRRVARVERFHEAHRSHAYQYAARKHGSHRSVTLTIGAINLAWLLPIAVLVALRLVDGVAAVIVAYAPLVWLAFRYHAGDRASQDV